MWKPSIGSQYNIVAVEYRNGLTVLNYLHPSILLLVKNGAIIEEDDV